MDQVSVVQRAWQRRFPTAPLEHVAVVRRLTASLAMVHSVSYVLLETEFVGFIVCYAVFFRLEEIPVRARSVLGPRFSEVVDVG